MTISKIQLKENKTFLVTSKTLKSQEGGLIQKQIQINSTDDRDPEFTDDFNSLRHYFEDILEFEKGYLANAYVTTLNLKREGNGALGATVAIVKPIEFSNRPLVINTPYMLEDVTGENEHAIPEAMLKTINRIIEHAKAFENGKRAQGELFKFVEQSDEQKELSPPRIATPEEVEAMKKSRAEVDKIMLANAEKEESEKVKEEKIKKERQIKLKQEEENEKKHVETLKVKRKSQSEIIRERRESAGITTVN